MIVPGERLPAEDREQPFVVALECPLMHDELDHEVVAHVHELRAT